MDAHLIGGTLRNPFLAGCGVRIYELRERHTGGQAGSFKRTIFTELAHVEDLYVDVSFTVELYLQIGKCFETRGLSKRLCSRAPYRLKHTIGQLLEFGLSGDKEDPDVSREEGSPGLMLLTEFDLSIPKRLEFFDETEGRVLNGHDNTGNRLRSRCSVMLESKAGTCSKCEVCSAGSEGSVGHLVPYNVLHRRLKYPRAARQWHIDCPNDTFAA